jgi:hypothetical protein
LRYPCAPAIRYVDVPLKPFARDSKELEAGKITYSKVRIVTRVATPETDAKYAYLCLHSPALPRDESVCTGKADPAYGAGVEAALRKLGAFAGSTSPNSLR